jgi:hypothetical protein
MSGHQERLYYHDDKGELAGIPAAWTSLEEKHSCSSEANFFLIEDLLVLVQLVAERKPRRNEKENVR